MPPGTSLTATEQAAEQVEQAVRGRPDIAATVTNVGQILGGFGTIPQQGAQYAQINLRLIEKAGLLDRFRGGGTRLRHESDEEITTRCAADLKPLASTHRGQDLRCRRALRGGHFAARRDPIAGRGCRAIDPLCRDRARSNANISGHPRPGCVGAQRQAGSAGADRPGCGPRKTTCRLLWPGPCCATAWRATRTPFSGGPIGRFRARRAGRSKSPESRAGSTGRAGQRESQAGESSAITRGQPVPFGCGDTFPQTGPSAIERTMGSVLSLSRASLAPDTPLGNAQQVIQKETGFNCRIRASKSTGAATRRLSPTTPYPSLAA